MNSSACDLLTFQRIKVWVTRISYRRTGDRQYRPTGVEEDGRSVNVLQNMTFKGINVKSAVAAGFVAGYVMYFVDHWLAGFLGLFGSFPGTGNAWWMLQHHVDSILFTLVFAWPAVYALLPGRKWFKGLTFGLVWMIGVTIIELIAGALGAQPFGHALFTFQILLTSLLLHLVWGFFLGVLYVPPAREQTGSETQGMRREEVTAG
jgi:hypothetical protein